MLVQATLAGQQQGIHSLCCLISLSTSSAMQHSQPPATKQQGNMQQRRQHMVPCGHSIILTVQLSLPPSSSAQVGLPLRPRRSSVTVPKSPMLHTKLRAKEVGRLVCSCSVQDR